MLMTLPLVSPLDRGRLGGAPHLPAEVERDTGELPFDVAHDLALSGRRAKEELELRGDLGDSQRASHEGARKHS